MSIPHLRALRVKVFDHYGWACQCCGSIERPSIDHVDGDGRLHREALGIGRSSEEMYRWLVRNEFPDGFQTLCVPCNKSKGTRERCIIDHASGESRGMSSAERARRWRQMANPSRTWATCISCRTRQRLRSTGLVEKHGACPGGGRLPRAGCIRGLGWPVEVSAPEPAR